MNLRATARMRSAGRPDRRPSAAPCILPVIYRGGLHPLQDASNGCAVWPNEARLPKRNSRGASRRYELPRRHRLLAPVVVEAALGLASEPSGFDVLHQQRTGTVLGIRQALVQ